MWKYLMMGDQMINPFDRNVSIQNVINELLIRLF